MAVRIPDRLAEQLRRQAGQENNGVSALVRRLITTGLNQEQKARDVNARAL